MYYLDYIYIISISISIQSSKVMMCQNNNLFVNCL